jgi:hypothetical protein
VNKPISNEGNDQNLRCIENILNINQYDYQQTMMYEQLTINTNLDENYQPIQRELNTPNKLDYFNNQFTDELGITVHREVQNYVDNNNLVMIAPNLNGLTSNSFINVTNHHDNNRQSLHQSSVVDINNNNQNGHYENESDDDENGSQEFNYSQVEGEKGRAKPFQRDPVVSDLF